MLTKNPNLKIFFSGGGGAEGGGRGGGGGGGEFRQKKKTKTEREKNKTVGIRLLFSTHGLHKILSSWLKWFSKFNTSKRSNGQIRGITLPMFYGI